jgi:CheY-like chemotaxis protein
MKSTKPRILLFEDSPGDILLLQTAVEESGGGADFETALDGDKAMQRLRALAAEPAPDHPRLILLDLNLPRVRGQDLLAFIRRTPALDHIPTLVFTTSDAPHDREQCMALGCVDFVVKPPDFTGYLEFVQSLGPFLAESAAN